MASVLKSESSPNGIILKEISKKFEEATSTSGCDLEMSEITSSMPNSLLNIINKSAKHDVSAFSGSIVDIVKDNVDFAKVNDSISSEIEDVIDGFSIFSFLTEEDIIKFSIKNEKIESPSELENGKCKKSIKSRKQNKIDKAVKESSYNDDCIDIYDFQGNSESSPSSKNSSLNFKKAFSKKFSNKHDKKLKHKFKAGNTLSPSEENSSSTSATESHNTLLGVDGRNESPRPTSNDDNNVVSTTTPDNVNIGLDKLDLVDKIQSVNLINPLKTASLRLYKLEDELSISGHSVEASIPVEKVAEVLDDQQLKFYSGPDNEKEHSIQSAVISFDGKYSSKLGPTKFSVDLITKISDESITDEPTKYLNDSSISDWNVVTKIPCQESDNSSESTNNTNKEHTAFDKVVSTPESNRNRINMTSTAVKHINDPSESRSRKSPERLRNNSSTEWNNEVQLMNDDDRSNDKTISKNAYSANSPMQSWLELHAKGLLHQQQNSSSQSNEQNNSNSNPMTPKSTGSCPLTSLNNHSHGANSLNNNKSQHDPVLLDWKNKYLESSKLLTNPVSKYPQSLSSLSHELASNLRYQQEQQELIYALRLKHENSKIPKPLVHMGLESFYKDHPLYQNSESRFQSSNVQSFFMPNSHLPAEFNTANVFKTRTESQCHQNSSEVSSNKDSFSKAVPSSSIPNFKYPETLKRRGQWCDMHVKIAYFIYRSQRRMSMIKTQEINSQLSHLMYNQKMPAAAQVPTTNAYPSGFLPHSNSYLDYRSPQLKSDPGYHSYQSKTSNGFLSHPNRPINPYHSIIPQNIESDLIPPSNTYEEHHQNPEQKWLKLLSHYMSNHPLSSVDRSNPEMLNQLYLWYQQFAQSNSNMPHFNPLAPSNPPLPPANMESNGTYWRKYMEHLSSCLGSIKGDQGGYSNSSMTERDMQIYLLKQQHYHKAMMSKYQTSAIHKPTMNHINPMLINPPNPFYNKKLLDMKAVNQESLMPPYPDHPQSFVNQKYHLSHDQIRQIKQESSRNGFPKLSDASISKRRKLNSESLKSDVVHHVGEKDEPKVICDLTTDGVDIATVYNKNNNTIINNNGSVKNKMTVENCSSKTLERI